MKGLTAIAISALLGCSGAMQAEIQSPELLPENNAQAYVLGAIDTHSVVLLGEPHLGISSERAFLSGLMPYLHQHGVERIALEIDSVYQQQVDDYLATGVKGDAWFFTNPSYFPMLEAARASHLKILCIDDVRYHSPDNRLLADNTMFENVREALSNGEKTLVFGGASHISEAGDTLGGLLDALIGDESFSIILPVEGTKNYPMLADYYSDYRAVDLDNSAVGGLLDSSGFTLAESYDAAVFLPAL